MSFESFNESIWHALWVLCPLGAVVFVLAFRSVKRGYHYFFEPKHNTDERLKDAGDFGGHCQRYQDLSKLAIALSAGAIAFLINTLVGQKSPANEFSKRLAEAAPIVVGFFGAAIALLILFMVLQAVWYERYCHSASHSTYKAWKYALCSSLGWSELVSFVMGFGWLARDLFS
jgi:hypothetical protein